MCVVDENARMFFQVIRLSFSYGHFIAPTTEMFAAWKAEKKNQSQTAGNSDLFVKSDL